MTIEQCESFDGMTNARCCFHKGHSGDHYHSREDESDRIRWKLAADERESLRQRLTAMTAARDELADIARCAASMAKAYIEIVISDLNDDQEQDDDLGQTEVWIEQSASLRKVGT